MFHKNFFYIRFHIFFVEKNQKYDLRVDILDMYGMEQDWGHKRPPVQPMRGPSFRQVSVFEILIFLQNKTSTERFFLKRIIANM